MDLAKVIEEVNKMSLDEIEVLANYTAELLNFKDGRSDSVDVHTSETRE